MKRKSGVGPGYFLMGLIFLMCVMWVLDGSLNGSEPEWSQVRQLFEQEKVEEFSISSDSVLTMKLRDAAEGSEIMRYQLYDFQMFYDELNDLVLEQTAKGIITGYD